MRRRRWSSGYFAAPDTGFPPAGSPKNEPSAECPQKYPDFASTQNRGASGLADISDAPQCKKARRAKTKPLFPALGRRKF